MDDKGVSSKPSGKYIVAPIFFFWVRDFKLWLLLFLSFPLQYDSLNLGGSGMAITGDPINLPGCQGQVTASDFANECSNCNACIQSHPCTECQYWPIYPCYSSKVCTL